MARERKQERNEGDIEQWEEDMGEEWLDALRLLSSMVLRGKLNICCQHVCVQGEGNSKDSVQLS